MPTHFNNIPKQIPGVNDLRDAFNIPDQLTVLVGAKIILKNKKQPNAVQHDYQIDNTDNGDKALDYKSILGTPIYTNIEFLPGSYETRTKGVFKSFGSATDGPNRLRYEAVLLTIAQEKQIIKTKIAGRDGTVKEYIGEDDFKITVNGIITGSNGVRPLDQIIALKKMLRAPVPIEVASTLLNQGMDINWLVLESYELEEKEGGYSFQTFSLQFISDVQQEIQLTNL